MLGPSATVRTRGLTSADWRIQKFVLAVSPIGLLIILLRAGVDSLASLPGPLAVWAIVIAVVDLAMEAPVSVRSIRIDPAGVTFRYLFHTRFGNWVDLSPSPRPARRGLWFIHRQLRPGSRTVDSEHMVTVEQARAVIGHPSCPPWHLSPEVRASLGLDPEVLPGSNPVN